MRLRFVCGIAVTVFCGLAFAQDKPAEDTKPAEKAAAPTPPPRPTTVKLIINTKPRKRAWVYHGRNKLGFTPLELELPYDSGPRDIVIKTRGYLTVNTRLYTFRDEKVIVTLTPEEEANTLFGYREEIPPDAGLPEEADAGVDSGATAPGTAPATPAPGTAPATPAPGTAPAAPAAPVPATPTP